MAKNVPRFYLREGCDIDENGLVCSESFNLNSEDNLFIHFKVEKDGFLWCEKSNDDFAIGESYSGVIFVDGNLTNVVVKLNEPMTKFITTNGMEFNVCFSYYYDGTCEEVDGPFQLDDAFDIMVRQCPPMTILNFA